MKAKKPKPRDDSAGVTKKNVGGRPSIFTDETAAEICERIATGESVRQICLLEHMPAERTLFTWLMKNEKFRALYSAAKSAQADLFCEELLEIADDSRNDWIERENERTGAVALVLNEEAIQRAKLRIETRKWLMSKFKPKRYGDRVELEHSGEVRTTITLEESRRVELQDRRRNAILAGGN